MQALAGRGCLFEDPCFPASAESLYRTPQQPPAGALPASLAVWARVSQQEVRRCHTPVTFPDGELEGWHSRKSGEKGHMVVAFCFRGR